MEHGYLNGLEERLAFLKESQFWPKHKLEDYQLKELQELLAHAYANVPFYRNTFDRLRFDVRALKSLRNLEKIPCIDKETVKQNYKEFRALNYKNDQISCITTGGSTGNPLEICIDETFDAYRHATTYFYLCVLNGDDFNPRQHKSIRLHGDVLSKMLTDQNIFWEKRENKLVMSSYHINADTVNSYIYEINRFRPEYIHAYPSAIYLLAKHMAEHKLNMEIKINCVYCDSETLYDFQKEVIQEIFGCPVYQVYGHTEGATIAIQCRQSDYLHFVPQVGIFELLHEDGTKVDDEGAKGEIVVTGFHNRVMPFIRYKTGDVGVLTKKKCPCCRDWPLIQKVEGRLQDYAVDKKENLVAIGPTLFDYNIDWSGIDKFQIYQDAIGKLVFKIKILNNKIDNSKKIAENFSMNMKNVFIGAFNIEIKIVEELAFTRIGKFRYLDQRLDMGRLSSQRR